MLDLPEVAILSADQKERGFWGRDWIIVTFSFSRSSGDVFKMFSI